LTLNVTTLRKILGLEQEKGCQDRAVIGGLDSYLNRWGSEARDSLEGPQLEMLAVSYAALDTGQRREWVKRMIGWLDEMENDGRRAPVLRGDSLDLPITSIKGISSSLAVKFCRLGVETVHDMLYFFPRRHIDYSKRKTIAELEIGEEQTVVATLWQAQEAILGGRRST
jgi:ATP-dependent DNA helicase RecG